MIKFQQSLASGHFVLTCTAVFAMSVGVNANAQVANLAANKPTLASSVQASTFAAAGVVDDNFSTRWSSSFSDAEWIQVDLGAVQTFNTVTLVWNAAFAQAYKLQVSADGSNWKDVFTTSNGRGGTEKVGLKPTSTRFVRMQGVQRATKWGYSLYEFKVSNESGKTAAAAVRALPTDAIFAPTSFWYHVIPANVALHPNSANFTAEFQRQLKAYYGNVKINTTSYASPVYTAPANAPTTAVQYWNCQGKKWTDPSLLRQWSAVPVPSYAQQASGSDAEMTIYQPASDTIWEFWQTRNQGGVWQACWGGRLEHASKSDGIFPAGFGTTATGLPFLGGQITAEELKRGEIRHALGISLVDVERWGILSWPANRSDGYNPNNAPNRIAEGQRFRLDPTVDVDALSMHPIGKIVAKAAQKYGFVVWDKAGSISLRAQNPKSYTAPGHANPYSALFNGTGDNALLDGFPWHRLQFLPMNYGKP
jgi:hypothetical protein